MPTNPISRDIESQPLLTQSPATTPSRLGALKSRSISQASIAFAPSNRWWTLTTAALVTILVGAIVGGILSSADVSKHHAEEPKPDWTVLPPPAPGLRNPSYLVSGHHGAVASEVGLCSQVGVEGTLAYSLIDISTQLIAELSRTGCHISVSPRSS